MASLLLYFFSQQEEFPVGIPQNVPAILLHVAAIHGKSPLSKHSAFLRQGHIQLPIRCGKTHRLVRRRIKLTVNPVQRISGIVNIVRHRAMVQHRVLAATQMVDGAGRYRMDKGRSVVKQQRFRRAPCAAKIVGYGVVDTADPCPERTDQPAVRQLGDTGLLHEGQTVTVGYGDAVFIVRKVRQFQILGVGIVVQILKADKIHSASERQ